MKVVSVETHLVSVDHDWLLVQVHTDEGLTGVGEASPIGLTRLTLAGVQELARYLVGRDPSGIEGHWQAMYRGSSRYRGGVVRQSALGAIDMALWDIEGQRLGVPVYRLLGGPYRWRIRAYANHWYRGLTEPAQFAEAATEQISKGYTAFKLSPWGAQGEFTERETLRRAVGIVQAVREAVGPDVDLAIEAGERFLPRTAVQAAHAFEPYDIFFLEEPVPFENTKALAKVARSINIPVATGERLYSRYEYRELLELQAADIVQPDIKNAGGITEVKKIATMAETYQVQLAPHNPCGPWQCLASIHIAAACSNFLILETTVGPHAASQSLAFHPPRVDTEGYFSLPEKPGLGASLLVEGLREWPYRSTFQSSHFTFKE